MAPFPMTVNCRPSSCMATQQVQCVPDSAAVAERIADARSQLFFADNVGISFTSVLTLNSGQTPSHIDHLYDLKFIWEVCVRATELHLRYIVFRRTKL